MEIILFERFGDCKNFRVEKNPVAQQIPIRETLSVA